MSDPIRIYGTITGDDIVYTRFMTHGDRVREAVKKALRRLGAEGKLRVQAAVPRSSGKRSKWSMKVGPLNKRVGWRLKSSDRAGIKLSMRPTPFYALFLEGGWTTAPTRRGNKLRSGVYGADRKVIVGRKWGAGGGKISAHQRKVTLRDESENTIGKRLLSVREHKKKAWTYKSTTHHPARPFFKPVADWMRSEAQGRIAAAVAEGLRAS